MTKLPTPKRALKVIEGLCYSAYDSADEVIKADDIYIVAHLFGSCKNKHDDWRKKFYEIEKALKKGGII